RNRQLDNHRGKLVTQCGPIPSSVCPIRYTRQHGLTRIEKISTRVYKRFERIFFNGVDYAMHNLHPMREEEHK
ncbi:MAG: hypothetical protein QXV37_04695, partial [Candidatus Jordarchaeaceae archaeon]